MSSTGTQQYLICPITLELFNDPVIAEDGYTYERQAITDWINRHGTSPVTKKTLNIGQLTSNPIIKDTVDTFKQQQLQTQHNAQSNNKQENLDVLCRYCGSTQQFRSIKQHQLQCSSKSINVVPFDIADNEIIFKASAQSTSSNHKPSQYEKIFSFGNPLARRTTNSTTTDERNHTSIEHIGENLTYTELPRKSRFPLLQNRRVKCFAILLLAILLTTMAITLTVYYVKRPVVSRTVMSTTAMSTSAMFPTTTTVTFTSTVSSTIVSTMTSPTTTTSPTTMTSPTTTTSPTTLTTSLSSSLPTPCASAEWSVTGVTVVSNLYSPHDIAIDSHDNLIVADTENHRLLKYLNDGTNITLVTETKIINVFIDKFDHIYIADSFRDEVKVLNSNGELITIIDGSNITDSLYDHLDLTDQSGLYVDKNNTVYFSDTGNHRIIKYFLDFNYGIVVAGQKGQGSELNQLNGPYGIYVDEVNEIGAIYICDHQNHRIQKWLSGTNEGITVAISDDQLHAPISILLQPVEDQMIMFISSFYRNQVLKWIPYAQEAESIVVGISGHMGTETDRLFAPRGIKFDKYWNLFIADAGNNRIQKFLFNTTSCEHIR